MDNPADPYRTSSASSTCRRTAARPTMCSLAAVRDRKSTRLNSSHLGISYAVFCLKKKKSHIGSQADVQQNERGTLRVHLDEYSSKRLAEESAGLIRAISDRRALEHVE